MIRLSSHSPPPPPRPPTIPPSSRAAAAAPLPARTAAPFSALLCPPPRPMATLIPPGRVMTPFSSRKRCRQTSTSLLTCQCCSDWHWCVHWCLSSHHTVQYMLVWGYMFQLKQYFHMILLFILMFFTSRLSVFFFRTPSTSQRPRPPCC